MAPSTEDGPPRAYRGFGGRVGRVFATSEPWWPARPAPSPGAPNIVIVLVDDLGYSDLGCYGSEIATPEVDRLAAEGLRYTDFHATPMCSPSRAALLTGVHPHLAGVGTVAHADPGFPGYAMELADDVATMAEILRDNGYATLMVGKWHLAKDSHLSDAGPRHAWPCQRGFDRFYGFLDGFTNLHHPHRLVEDNHTVAVDRYPDGYYLTDDLTDRAIAMVRAVRAADPTKPFLLYVAHGAVHAPLQAKPDDIARYADRYHGGWDALRAERFARQQAMGLVPQGTALPPPNREPGHDVVPWGELSAPERELFARYMAVYAAMVANVDDNLGRLRAALEELGAWDDTLVLFTSDNGASREGEAQGTAAYFRTLNWLTQDSFDDDHARLADVGGPRALAHYPRGWAMASNTPFRLYKVNTHRGGHSVPAVVSWPARLRASGAAGSLRHQYVHLIDVLPTVLDLAGIDPPVARRGVALQPVQGASFAATLTDPAAQPPRRTQHYEMLGHRGYYRDGWEVVTLHHPRTAFAEDRWELYDLRADPTETTDLAAAHPERVAELAAAWEDEAWASQVFPLDEGTGLKYLLRPPTEDVFGAPVTIVAGTPTLERYRSYKLVQLRSFTITVLLTHGRDDEGVLVAHGDQGGGYVVYVEDGMLAYAHNGYGTMQLLAAGAGALGIGDRAVVVEATARAGHRWDVRLMVDGRTVAAGEGFPMLAAMAPFEGIDVGIDRRSPVSWDLYERHGPFPYSGQLRSVTYTPGEFAPDAGPTLVGLLRQIGQRYE